MPGRERPNPKSTPREIVGQHGHKPHGSSILWPALYEHLLKKGKTKEAAARISNAAWNKKHAGMSTNTPTSSRGFSKEWSEAARKKAIANRRRRKFSLEQRKALLTAQTAGALDARVTVGSRGQAKGRKSVEYQRRAAKAKRAARQLVDMTAAERKDHSEMYRRAVSRRKAVKKEWSAEARRKTIEARRRRGKKARIDLLNAQTQGALEARAMIRERPYDQKLLDRSSRLNAKPRKGNRATQDDWDAYDARERSYQRMRLAVKSKTSKASPTGKDVHVDGPMKECSKYEHDKKSGKCKTCGKSFMSHKKETKKEWSAAARKKAIEARRRKSKKADNLEARKRLLAAQTEGALMARWMGSGSKADKALALRANRQTQAANRFTGPKGDVKQEDNAYDRAFDRRQKALERKKAVRR